MTTSTAMAEIQREPRLHMSGDRHPRELAVPLTPSQIDAACRLRACQLPRWVATDNALDALAKQFPGFCLEAAILKVAAINQLYGTNVFAVARMAEHAVCVMADKSDTTAPATLVERLAAMPPAHDDDEKKHIHWSFAAKFAHFFVDNERFPIYDSYAKAMLAYHLGPQGLVTDTAHPYRAYLENLESLRSYLGFSCGNRPLDRYLWLAGVYRTWRRKPTAQINTEVAALLTEPTPQITADLAALLLP